MIVNNWICVFEDFHEVLIGGRLLRLYRSGRMIWAEDVIEDRNGDPIRAEGETFDVMKEDAVRKVYRYLLEIKAEFEAKATEMGIALG